MSGTSAAPGAVELAPGCVHVPGFLDEGAQAALLETLARDVIARAPFFQPRIPRWNTPMSVRMTNCGPLGWVSDRRGYRYQPTHPDTGEPWPALPRALLDAWEALAGHPRPPEAALVNLYGPAARMGMHQDRDEEDLEAPVVSLSLGDTGVFRLGGLERGGPARSVELKSGDALVLGGPSRLAFHGVSRIRPGTSDLVPRVVGEEGRINVTLRRVTRA